MFLNYFLVPCKLVYFIITASSDGITLFYVGLASANLTRIDDNLKQVRGALGYFLGGYVPPGTPNRDPVLEKISPKIDTPF